MSVLLSFANSDDLKRCFPSISCCEQSDPGGICDCCLTAAHGNIVVLQTATEAGSMNHKGSEPESSMICQISPHRQLMGHLRGP